MWITGVAAVLIVGALLVCGMLNRAMAQSAGAEAGERPILFLANESLPPMNFMKNGNPTGIVVDLAKALAKNMHHPVEIRLIDWTEAQQLVLEGRADALLQINPSPERLRMYDFSEPLLTSEFSIFTSVERLGISSMSDLRGLRVGVEQKGLPISLLQGDPKIVIQIIPDFVQGFKMLEAGTLDAVAADRWVGSYVVAENKVRGVKVIEEPISRSNSAIAVKKGNTNLLGEINAALADIRRDGTYDRIIKSWQSKEVVFKTREQLRQQAWLIAVIAAALVVALGSVAVLVREIRRRTRVEATLRESEAKYRNLFENMAEEVHFWQLVRDEAGQIQTWKLVDVNPPTLKTWGRSRVEEIRAKTTDEIFGPGAREHYMPVVQKIMTEGVPHSFEDYFPNLDRYFRFTSVPLGEYFITTGADITGIKKAELALRESEARYRSLFEHMLDGFAYCQMLFDAQGRPDDFVYLAVNEAFGRLSGLNDVIGKRATQVMPRIKELQPELFEIYGRVASTGAPERFEIDFKPLGLYLSVSVYSPAKGYLVVVFDNITARKRAEVELERTRNTLAEAQRIAHLGSFEYVAATRTTVWSEEEYRIYGLDPAGPSPAYDVMLARCIHPDDAALLHETFTKAMQTGGIYELEHRIVRPNGSVRWVYDRAHPYLDKDRKLLRYVGATLDITERKAAEKALSDEQARLSAILENLPVGVWIVDAAGRVTSKNKAADLIWRGDAPLSSRPGDYVEYAAWDGETGKRLETEDYPLARTLRTGLPIAPVELRIRRFDGTEGFIMMSTVPLRSPDGSLTGAVGINVDITERKQAEEALKRAYDDLDKRVEEKTSDLAVAVERLRAENIARKQLEDTLRQSEYQVRFFASQCLTAQETERKRVAGELHDSIAASLGAMKFRIDRIADELKEGKATPESLHNLGSKVMETNNEVRRIMADLRPSVLDDLGIVPAMNWLCREYQKTYFHISVENEIGISEQDVPDSLKTPIFRICQESMNNIAKYSKASHVNLSLQKENNGILLTIQDNGQGFDPNTVKRGMGLSTMRERAQLSGGSFELESAEGKGTTIRASWTI